MASPTDKAHIQKMYDLYCAAEEQILGGAQSYMIAGRQLVRADLRWIASQREMWGKKLQMINGDNTMGPRVQSVVPR